MFERYTEKARRTIFFARYEASQFGTPEIESEHLLLGILREGKAALNAILGLTQIEDIRLQIESRSTIGPKTSTSVDMKLTNECKRILAYGAEEAMRMDQKHIGIEHLLLGILREDKCLAAQILHKQGVKLDKARKLISAAEDQLVTAPSHPVPPQEVQPEPEELPPTRNPVAIRVILTCESETLVAYRSHLGPPRIGESVRIRDDDGATHNYRVQDVIWDLALDEPIVLKEVNVRVVKANAE